MLGKKDIEQAKKLFIDWDNNSKWKKPSPLFIEHTRKKAEGTLNLAVYLSENIEKTEDIKTNETVPLWIITQSYYSMFFLTEYLLSLDSRQMHEGAKDTHKTIYLALLYYYLVKGSELEKNSLATPTTSRMSRALSLFKESQDEALELARIRRNIDNLNMQREERNKFTYRMQRSAEVLEATRALNKAIEYRNLIIEYIKSRKIKH